ncbi:MAG: ligase-associated DNA damage response exonuclease [Alphaproteobacteria bacterium]
MRAHSTDPERWLKVTEHGLYCEPGNFYVDPSTAVERAVITHGHADHARPGHDSVLATPATLAIMRARYGPDAARSAEALDYGDSVGIAGVRVRLAPAGHVLGSAQVVLEHGGVRIVVSGDYKRQPDPTCPAFEPVPCDVFITEATFGLPVFRHPPAADEIARVLGSLRRFPERTHLIGVYALGKAQRVVMLLRAAGYDAPIYIHGALANLCALYRSLGVALGELRLTSDVGAEELAGAIVLAPPSALNDRWSRRMADPVRAMASGWMRVRARARQRGAELPLVISDHADWDELSATLEDVGAARVWVTHGREEALVHHARGQGFDARALYLLGREEEGE